MFKTIDVRAASRLGCQAVVKGDVVAFQLPNWWEFTALFFACNRIGAVANPHVAELADLNRREMLVLGVLAILRPENETHYFPYRRLTG